MGKFGKFTTKMIKGVALPLYKDYVKEKRKNQEKPDWMKEWERERRRMERETQKWFDKEMNKILCRTKEDVLKYQEKLEKEKEQQLEF